MWDFGDGGMSTEENPVYTYTAEGEYTVTLTAMDNQGKSDMTSQTITIAAAMFSGSVLSDADGKTWVLNGANSYFVGPGAGSGEWWPGPSEADVTGPRSCQFDDEFIFSDDGTMAYDAKGEVYAEAYMLGPDACIAEGDLTPPYDAFASGTHMFVVTEATDTDPAKITVIGQGAFLGFNKGFNGGEYDQVIAPKDQTTYTVHDYSNVGGVELLTVTIDISADETGGAWWTMVLRAVE
jgi:PKD repeat protein